jgi:hypothetical protein
MGDPANETLNDEAVRCEVKLAWKTGERTRLRKREEV